MNNTSRPKRSLGQNYLHDENICRNIIRDFKAWKRDYIIEIGPGKGAITKFLLDKTNNLTVVEIDKENVDHLRDLYEIPEILNTDILELDLEKFTKEKEVKKVSMIGNIPYNITTPILFKLVDNRRYINTAQLMMQEEVTQRIVSHADSKEYGILSVLIQTFADSELLFKVSRNCFYPKPNVDSRIIRLNFAVSKESLIDDIEDYRKLIRTAFSKRRKTLRNNLKDTEYELLIDNAVIDFSRRAENISVMEFIELSNFYTKLKLTYNH
jgi:16S rRNA (adenine1518-N6/adenine1519-N6)-dimethyltransferase